MVPMQGKQGVVAFHGPGSAAVPAASCGGVPPLARTPGGTPSELAGEDACDTSVALFMVAMHGKNDEGAFQEPYEFRERAPIESGGGPPHSKTPARRPQSLEPPPGFGVRRRCGALDFPGRFMAPMKGSQSRLLT